MVKISMLNASFIIISFDVFCKVIDLYTSLRFDIVLNSFFLKTTYTSFETILYKNQKEIDWNHSLYNDYNVL